MTPFALPPKVPLARLPTPIHRLDRLSKQWGAELWIKRDDLTGADLSGNKVRKLEFELADALAKNCGVTITCGGVQSNHARATAIASRRLGLVPHLVLRTADGKAPPEIDGNLLLDRMVGAEVTWVTPEQYRSSRGAIMREIGETYRGRGLAPYVIPEGASDARGALGYVAAVQEIQEQLRDAALPRFEYVAHACGSGGTSAGLAFGNEIFAAGLKPVAFAVCDDIAYFRDVIGGIAKDFATRFGGISPAASTSSPALEILDRHKGIGYAQSTAEELAFLRRLAETEGILLDPVYTGKAMLGLSRELAAGTTFRKGAPILFLHTGGLFGLFPKKTELFP